MKAVQLTAELDEAATRRKRARPIRFKLNMEASTEAIFKSSYQRHLQHLKLKGLQPKTIDAYSRATRRMVAPASAGTATGPAKEFACGGRWRCDKGQIRAQSPTDAPSQRVERF